MAKHPPTTAQNIWENSKHIKTTKKPGPAAQLDVLKL
jgi:hypothetical protein